MSIVIVGGNECMACRYREICSKYGYEAKVFCKMQMCIRDRDSARELTPEERSLLRETSVPLVVALNKTDLNARTGVEDVRAALQGAQAFAILLTSAVTGEGIEDLRRALYEAALRGASPEEAYLTNERHVQAAKDALAALESAVTALEDRTLDCAALDLRAAWEALGAITGESATEDVIDRIFEKFCLGK